MNPTGDVSMEVGRRALQMEVRLGDPVHRMRRERWIALLILNGLLVVAALIQVIGRSAFSTYTPTPPDPSAMYEENYE